MYFVEMVDDVLLGLVRIFKDWFLDEVYNVICIFIYMVVLVYEVGYSLGFMYNFGGFDDVVNYYEGYWVLWDDGNMGFWISDFIMD